MLATCANNLTIFYSITVMIFSTNPSGGGIWFWTARTLVSWGRVPIEAWMYVSALLGCVVLCRFRFCEGQIHHHPKSHTSVCRRIHTVRSTLVSNRPLGLNCVTKPSKQFLAKSTNFGETHYLILSSLTLFPPAEFKCSSKQFSVIFNLRSSLRVRERPSFTSIENKR
jgi:hypothetical protein